MAPRLRAVAVGSDSPQSQQTLTTIETTAQQEVAANIAMVRHDNANRASTWATDANALILQVCITPLQSRLNDIAITAGLVGIAFPPLLVVAGAANLVNAGISALEGNYLSAGIYLAGALPLADFAAPPLAELADGLAPALTDAAPEVATVAADAGQVVPDALGAGGVEGTCGTPPGCFVAGTEVITGINANGSYSTTQIQDIAVGQDVLTRNANDPNGPLQEEAVTAVQVHTVYSLRLVNVKLADGTTETIDTTDSHPFYV